MSLTAKLIATLTFTIAVALLTAALLAGRAVNSAARGYFGAMMQERLAIVANQAAARYAQTGSWREAQDAVDEAWAASAPGRMMGRGLMAGRQHMARDATDRLLLVDPTSGAPLGAEGRPVDATALAVGAPVLVGSEQLAILAPGSSLSTLSTNEELLLTRINQALWWSALAAGLAALAAGGALAASILRPLRRLQDAVAQVAAGRLDVEASVRGSDEIAQLARSFNRMAAHLRQQEELRQRMVADIAHELRTPLSVVQGNLQAILDGVYPLEMREIQALADETQVLSRLVSDLHELAQAEAGQLLLERQATPVDAALRRTAESFRSLADQGRVTLVVAETPPDLVVNADPDRLQQILHNLLANALRHTPAGGSVHLAAHVHGAAVRFSIQDSGPGIAAADVDHIFDRFYRADRSRTRAAGYTSGVGLGLAIVKALVEAHGGRVGVESQEGRGAMFWFDLPVAN